MTLAATGSYPFLDLLWTMFLFFGLIVFFWLLMMVFGDLFRRHDIGGWAKTGWAVLVIVLPMIGCFIYLISQSHGMSERRAGELRSAQREMDEYIRATASGSNGTSRLDDIARAKSLLDKGAISQDEYEALKQRALV